MPTPLAQLTSHDEFIARHIGPSPDDLVRMLDVLGVASLDELLDQTVPASIRIDHPLDLPPARSETEVLAALRTLAGLDAPRTSLIGMGYSPTITPGVIQRNVLEDPAWYTAYTPYQAEISQGRLEALLNFQTMVAELTGLPVTNASLLDEATAAAEAMAMARRLSKAASNRFVVHHDTHPQTIAVLATRAEPIGIEILVGDVDDLDDGCFGALFSLPTSTGAIVDWRGRDRAGARGRRPRRRRHRPAGVRAGDAAGPARGRHRHRLGPAVRCPDDVRWSARRVHRRPGVGGAGPPRAHRRRQHRHRRSPRAALGPADARAAHPSREGDVQHLHGPGAAGQHRRVLRRLPRPGRVAPDRRAHPADGLGGSRLAARRRPGPAPRHVVRHGDGRRHRRGARDRRSAGRRRRPAAGRRDERRHLVRRDDHPRRRRPGPRGVRRGRRPRSGRRRTRRSLGGRPSHRRGPHPVGLQPLPHRARDAALPAPAVGRRPGPRSHDDPARLVHDEAQRDHGDGVGDVARVRRPCTRSRHSTSRSGCAS